MERNMTSRSLTELAVAGRNYRWRQLQIIRARGYFKGSVDRLEHIDSLTIFETLRGACTCRRNSDPPSFDNSIRCRAKRLFSCQRRTINLPDDFCCNARIDWL